MTVQVHVGSTSSFTGTAPSFTASGVTTSSDTYSMTTTGTVTSNVPKTVDNVRAVAVYYNASGAIVGGDFTYVDFIPAGASTSFSIDGLESIPGVVRTQVYFSVQYISSVG